MVEFALVAASIVLAVSLAIASQVAFRGGASLRQAIAFGAMGGFVGSFLALPISFLWPLEGPAFAALVLGAGAVFGAVLSWRWTPLQE